MLDVDAPLVEVFDAARHAPSGLAFLQGMTRVLVPALARAYAEYLAAADEIGDGPTQRFLRLGLEEKKNA